ncbi:MAG: hypothetical protein ABL900_09960 [Burkholderiaceae bacterium]
MDIDPIVLLAYISVSINIITMIAACIAYAIFHIRKRRRKRIVNTASSRPGAALTPIFLRRYPMPVTIPGVPGGEHAIIASSKTGAPELVGHE